jgi:hypothetical protein
MLDRDDARTAIQRPRDLDVVVELIPTDAMVDLDGVGRRLSGWMQSDDLATARRGCQVVRERRDAAASGRVGGNECDACDELAPLGRSASRGPRMVGPWSGQADRSTRSIDDPGGVPSGGDASPGDRGPPALQAGTRRD